MAEQTSESKSALRALGTVGVWSRELRFAEPLASAEAALELEELGYGTLWIPGGSGGTLLEAVRATLAATRRVVVATGILNIWGHDPVEVARGQTELDRDFPGRFLLGLGVGHARFVDADEPGRYRRPLEAMDEFLNRLDEHVVPETGPARVLAALAPKMATVAITRSAGVHPYMVPVEHTRWIREFVGPHALVAPELSVVVEDDPVRARVQARADLQLYLGLPNYTRTWLLHGIDEADLANGGSDRLIDTLYAHGSLGEIAQRIREHHDAGADHVCLRVVTGAPMTGIDEALPIDGWRQLAAVLE